MHRVFSDKGSFYLLGYGEMFLLALPLLAQEEGGMPIRSLEVLFPSLLKTEKPGGQQGKEQWGCFLQSAEK